MKLRTTFLSVALLMTPALFGQSAATNSKDAPKNDSAEVQQSPAERSIERALALIEKQPNHVPNWDGLAMAYARRARETSDVAFYGKAEEAIAIELVSK